MSETQKSFDEVSPNGMALAVRGMLKDTAVILVRAPHRNSDGPKWCWMEFKSEEDYDVWHKRLTAEERAAIQTFNLA